MMPVAATSTSAPSIPLLTDFATIGARLKTLPDDQFLQEIQASPQLLMPSKGQQQAWLLHMPFKRIAEIGNADFISKLISWIRCMDHDPQYAIGTILGVLNDTRVPLIPEVVQLSDALSSFDKYNVLNLGLFIWNRFSRDSFPNISHICRLNTECASQISKRRDELHQAWTDQQGPTSITDLFRQINENAAKLIQERDQAIAQFIQSAQKPSVQPSLHDLKV